jgi:hypothetical protein
VPRAITRQTLKAGFAVILQQVLRAGDESITPLFAPPAILRFLPFTQIRAAPRYPSSSWQRRQ